MADLMGKLEPERVTIGFAKGQTFLTLAGEGAVFDWDEYKKAVENGFDKPIPQAENYGLDPSFSRAQFEAQIEKLGRSATKKAFLFAFVPTAPIALLVANVQGDGYAMWIVCLVLWVFSFGNFRKRFVVENERRFNVDSIRTYLKDGEKWLQAFRDWTEARSETGLQYWLSSRGVGFEIAVKRMLERRGLTVEMTKGSGDGGIDLIVDHQGKVWWCQCKGHAKPISVAPVREIAGVCSRSQATPVIFSANGFSKPATIQAGELGVICVDGYGLVKLGKNADLAQNDWLRHAAGAIQTIRV